MSLIAFYHNEAAADKDICDSHFAHHQSRVEAYISVGKLEENIDPKTTCSCTKHKMCQEYHSTPSQTKVRFTVYGNQSSPINGISTFLASTYNHHSTNHTISFFHNLGQAVPSLIRNLTTASYFLLTSLTDLVIQVLILLGTKFYFTIWVLRGCYQGTFSL